MKYFKNPKDEVFAFNSDGSQDDFIPEDLIPITKEEADAINKAAVEASFEALTYGKKRQNEYPSLGDQLDALYHAGVFPTDMADRIKAIKEKYPKA